MRDRNLVTSKGPAPLRKAALAEPWRRWHAVRLGGALSVPLGRSGAMSLRRRDWGRQHLPLRAFGQTQDQTRAEPKPRARANVWTRSTC